MSGTLISEGSDSCSTESFSSSMPIVLHLEDRGDCAVENIELFDEGRFGADNLYFRGRFSTFKEVAQQVNAVLSLGNPLITPDKIVDNEVFKEEDGQYVFNENVEVYNDEENEVSVKTGNVLALNRFYSQKPIHYFKERDITDPYPYKAQYPIQFMIRIKFYGDFAYIWFGDRWKRTENGWETISGHEFNENGEKYVIDELEIVKHCMISYKDAKTIMDVIKKEGGAASTINNIAMALNDAKNDDESYLILDGGLLTDSDNNNLVIS